MKNLGWQRCLGRTQSGKILGSNKRFISLVRQPSEEVVILRTSQIENMVLIYGESGSSRSFSVRLKRATGILVSPPGKSGPGRQCSWNEMERVCKRDQSVRGARGRNQYNDNPFTSKRVLPGQWFFSDARTSEVSVRNDTMSLSSSFNAVIPQTPGQVNYNIKNNSNTPPHCPTYNYAQRPHAHLVTSPHKATPCNLESHHHCCWVFSFGTDVFLLPVCKRHLQHPLKENEKTAWKTQFKL